MATIAHMRVRRNGASSDWILSRAARGAAPLSTGEGPPVIRDSICWPHRTERIPQHDLVGREHRPQEPCLQCFYGADGAHSVPADEHGLRLAGCPRADEFDHFARGNLGEAARRFVPHTVKDVETGGAPVGPAFLVGALGPEGRMHDEDPLNPELAESGRRGQAGGNHADTLGAALETRAHTASASAPNA